MQPLQQAMQATQQQMQAMQQQLQIDFANNIARVFNITHTEADADLLPIRAAGGAVSPAFPETNQARSTNLFS